MRLLVFISILIIISSCDKESFDISSELRDDCRQGVNPIKKVLFIGYDGCRTDALLAAHTPIVDSMINHALNNMHCDVGMYTQSVPAWSTLLHGVWADKHGLKSNSFDDANYGHYPDIFHYARLSNPELSLATVSNWEGFLRITTEEDYAQYVASDEQVKDKAIELLNGCTPDILLLQFDEIDYTGHQSGFSTSNQEYIEAIERCAGYTEEIMQVIQMREAQNNEEWLVVLTSDHGGTGTSHGGKANIDAVRFVFLIVRGPGFVKSDIPNSTNADVMPTILDYLNIPIPGNLDGTSLLNP